MATLLNNKYQLVELISQSERNLVYKGYEPAMKREVAIKYLSPAASMDQPSIQQFRQEMQLIASLNHPNILPVYDYGLEESRLYLVTPYIPGGTLQDQLPQFHSLPRAYQLIKPIADALAYVHAQGLIHGNLKPANILIDEEWQPFLTDFGAFQKIGTRGLGSPYQSLEQARGGPIDARTDVYALGVLLYELLMGQSLPKGAIPSPHLQRPDLPLEVEGFILTAMAENPLQRFQSVNKFSQALEAVLGAEGQPTAPEAEKGFWQMIPWWGFALAGVLVLAIIGFAFFLLLGGFGGDPDSSGGSTIIIGGSVIVVPTPVPGGLSLTATNNVNIRSGPGLDYEILGILKQGQTAEVIGISPDSNWSTIKVAAAEGGQGWVSAQFVNAENTANVPIIQPPPVPQPTATPPVTFTDWRGEYFDNGELRDDPILVRDDPAINFNWGDGSPAPEVPTDNFSARWRINRQMPAGTYRFSIWVDDGARLYVDDRLIIDAWQSGPPRNYVADVNLIQGSHTIRLEYFEVDGGALITLDIGYIGEFLEWKAEYFSNIDLSGRPVVVHNEPDIDFNWGTGEPAPGVPGTNFSARWSRRIFVSQRGNYVIKIEVEGGARIFVDGQLLLDSWNSAGVRSLEAETGPISRSDHDVRVEYFKTGGRGQINLSVIQKKSIPPKAAINGTTQAQVGQTVSFNARNSIAVEGNHLVLFDWDFGDGASASGVDVAHVYNSLGRYTVRLTVTDDKNLSGTDTLEIQIDEGPETPEPEETTEPKSPSAAITASAPGQIIIPVDQTITVPFSQTITFDGSGSQPGSSTIISYTWTFDGIPSLITEPVVTQTYRATGSYQVTLTVTDENNQSDSLIWQVQVTQ